MSFAAAERIADAVLCEGYVLYPYRASAAKNRFRWQFGVIAPAGYVAGDPSEQAALRTECLLAAGERASLHVRARFLRLEARRVEVRSDDGSFGAVESCRVGDRDLVTWDVGIPQLVEVSGVRVAELLEQPRTVQIDLEALREVEEVCDPGGTVRARVVRERRPVSVRVDVSAGRVEPYVRVAVQIENTSDWQPEEAGGRDDALRQACTNAHVLLRIEDGAFVSLIDPPPEAAAAAACRNERLWPVLVGPPGRRDLVLASPIILSDHPEVAPESPGDLCDATEIDEMLMLRIMTMTDEEKREACATDERARRIVERADTLPPEVLERLHGAIRQPGVEEAFFNPPGEPPLGGGTVRVGNAEIGRGAQVRLRPTRRADTMDMFLRGRTATVAGVYRDVEDRTYVAVTIDDDPAADIQRRAGRFFYFYPDELEVLDTGRVAPT